MESGKKVKRIWWNGVNGDEAKIPIGGQQMVSLNEYHGEYDLDWICVLDETGKEIERHNVRYIASIEWA